MSRNYVEEDAALDEELKAMYAPQEESENAESNSPATAAPESEVHEPQAPETQALPEEGTPVEPEQTEQIEEQKESTVSEERYKAAVQAMNSAQRELADKRKHDASRDDLIQQLQAQVQQLKEDKPAAKDPDSTQPDAGENDDLADALEIYPEVVNPLLKRIASLEKRLANVSDDVGNVKTVADRYQKTEQETAEDKHWAFIKSKHSDVDEIVASPDYADWYPQQAPLIQQALQQGSAKDVVAALSLFRAEFPKSVPDADVVPETDKPVAPKIDKLAAAREAASPTIKSTQKTEQKPTFTNAQIEKMSRDEFLKHEAAIDEALARGEIN